MVLYAASVALVSSYRIAGILEIAVATYARWKQIRAKCPALRLSHRLILRVRLAIRYRAYWLGALFRDCLRRDGNICGAFAHYDVL
ncbi:hypothetical protein BDV10DRAFT_171058, partial [Aspergillus recurvatus]